MEARKLLFFLASLAILASPVLAAQTLTVVSIGGAPWPYAPYTVATSNHGTFNTFCVEWDRLLATGTPYDYTIDDDVQYGGSSSLLKAETKQIYLAYLNGDLTGLFTANQIQDEIWFWERGIGSFQFDSPVGDYTVNSSGIYASISGNTYSNYVSVLNLWDQTTGADVQSLLIAYPVPAPGAILLAGIGTSLVGWLRRRRAI